MLLFLFFFCKCVSFLSPPSLPLLPFAFSPFPFFFPPFFSFSPFSFCQIWNGVLETETYFPDTSAIYFESSHTHAHSHRQRLIRCNLTLMFFYSVPIKVKWKNAMQCSCCFRNPKQWWWEEYKRWISMLVNMLEQKYIKRNIKYVSGCSGSLVV